MPDYTIKLLNFDDFGKNTGGRITYLSAKDLKEAMQRGSEIWKESKAFSKKIIIWDDSSSFYEPLKFSESRKNS